MPPFLAPLHWAIADAYLVQPDSDITANPSGQVNLGLKIKLDADHQASILQFAIAVNGSLQEVSGIVVKTGASRGRDMA